MRILALDWGTVRIGAAMSDPEGLMAFPLDDFIPSQNGIREIKKLIHEYSIEKVLIGMPKSLAGKDTASSKSVKEFAKKLKSAVNCKYEFIDERLSSVGASKTLRSNGIRQKDQRGMVDNLAAAQLLQSYIDSNK